MRRLKNGKSVLGALKPTMLRRALPFLAAPLLALLNACVRVGQLPRTWAVSALVPICKPGADCLTPAGYRGIALGTLPAKLFGGMLAYGTKQVWSPPCWPLHQAMCCWQPRLVHALICLFGHMPVTPDCGTCVLCLTVVQLCGMAGAGGENMHSNLLSPTSGWVHRPNVE